MVLMATIVFKWDHINKNHHHYFDRVFHQYNGDGNAHQIRKWKGWEYSVREKGNVYHLLCFYKLLISKNKLAINYLIEYWSKSRKLIAQYMYHLQMVFIQVCKFDFINHVKKLCRFSKYQNYLNSNKYLCQTKKVSK